MNRLERYLAYNVLMAIGLVTLMLAGLQLFMLFVNQLGELGKAEYGLWAAVCYVFLEMPYEVYLFFPMASLLGCLIGLGQMASHHELVIMRASGLSMLQMTAAIMKVAVLVIVVVTLLGEGIMPSLVHRAHQQKMQALSGGHALYTDEGVWLRLHDDFLMVGELASEDRLLRVLQFHFDATQHLTKTRAIDMLTYSPKTRSWLAQGVHETQLFADHTVSKVYETMPWEVALPPKSLFAGHRQADEMTLYELHQWIGLQGVKTTQAYRLIYWQRLMQPFTTLVMMILAIPFIFGPLRSSTMGSKLLLGATMGFSFYILNRFLGSASQVYQWSPVLAAIGPTALFALLGLEIMRRAR